MNNADVVRFQLLIPESLDHQRARIVEAFNAENVEISIAGVYVTKAAGPIPDANFWIDVTRHALSYPFEHVIDDLEGAIGLALLAAFNRIRKWAGQNVRIHIQLPGTNRKTQYIIPDQPEDKAAIKAIKKHYESVKQNTANEYFWINGEWLNAADYWKRKR